MSEGSWAFTAGLSPQTAERPDIAAFATRRDRPCGRSRANYRLRGIKQVRASRCFRSSVATKLSSPLSAQVSTDHNHSHRRAVMNSRPFLISAILATTVTFGFSGNALSAPSDAQAQAAALLSGSPTSGSPNTPAPAYSPALAGVDAQTRAAALLSGVHTGHESKASMSAVPSAVALDAHAQAAALLSDTGSSRNRIRAAH